MSEFKFSQPERHNVERLLQQVRDMGLSVIEGVDRIEQIISARGESDGWVRVEDGLPEENQNCFFYSKGCRPLIGTYKPDGKAFLCSEDNDFWIIKEMDVSHWQPLPSPPKPDQQ